jgi:hypothetical protein
MQQQMKQKEKRFNEHKSEYEKQGRLLQTQISTANHAQTNAETKLRALESANQSLEKVATQRESVIAAHVKDKQALDQKLTQSEQELTNTNTKMKMATSIFTMHSKSYN